MKNIFRTISILICLSIINIGVYASGNPRFDSLDKIILVRVYKLSKGEDKLLYYYRSDSDYSDIEYFKRIHPEEGRDSGFHITVIWKHEYAKSKEDATVHSYGSFSDNLTSELPFEKNYTVADFFLWLQERIMDQNRIEKAKGSDAALKSSSF